MSKSLNQGYRPIYLFLAIMTGLSCIFYALMLYSGNIGGAKGLYVAGMMWCPGVAALITMKLLNRDLADLGWKWGKHKYQLQSYYIPILYALITYLIVWIGGFGGFYDKDFVAGITDSLGLGAIGDFWAIVIFVILNGLYGTIQGGARALGEEIGWRGFMVPELFKNVGFAKTSLITGVIWGAWHLPALLFMDYNNGSQSMLAMVCFMVSIVSVSFVYTWYRMKSGSLWTAVILHAAHNLYIQRIFTPLTVDTGNTAAYIDEFGIILPIVSVVFAIYFWTKREEL